MSDMPQPTDPAMPPPLPPKQPKQRHGCLTAWLILLLIGSGVTIVFYLFATEFIAQHFPEAPMSGFYALAAVAGVNILCVIALFNWKWIGFLGLCVSAVVAIVINLLMGLPVVNTIFGAAAGVGILVGVLHIGDARTKGWPQLE